MATEKAACVGGGSKPLEQFVLLSKTAKGIAAVELIKQALAAPQVYVFGELLDMTNIQQLAGTPHSQYLDLLNLFAFGTLTDYKAAPAGSLPELSPPQLKKLQQLTIVTLATKQKCIPYSALLEELDIKNLRELEDLIIEVIYADIIYGKLDQQNQTLEVDYAIGRDIKPGSMKEVIIVLQDWCNSCQSVLSSIEEQVVKANTQRERHTATQTQVETEVANIRKTLKTSQTDSEEQMVTDSRDPQPSGSEKPTKKSSKTKGLRGSGKFWGKSS